MIEHHEIKHDDLDELFPKHSEKIKQGTIGQIAVLQSKEKEEYFYFVVSGNKNKK